MLFQLSGAQITFVKDSQQVVDEIKSLNLPPQAKLFTCNANAMYNNINTEHAIQVITWWLRDLETTNRLPMGFPLAAVLEAMVVIMKNNIFEFGTCYFLQLVGTAMGTSATVMWRPLSTLPTMKYTPLFRTMASIYSTSNALLMICLEFGLEMLQHNDWLFAMM
jgi:hypothetical protein